MWHSTHVKVFQFKNTPKNEQKTFLQLGKSKLGPT